jgi:hypothetical protein
VGVIVHSGDAESGHYYSFIQVWWITYYIIYSV